MTDKLPERVPEPALIRGFLVALVGLVSIVLGKQYDVSWIDDAVTVYAVGVPLLLSLWIRSKVSPAEYVGRHRK